MMNNKQASELISKSLLGKLSTDEQARMDQHLKDDPDALAFSKLSVAINSSVLKASHSTSCEEDQSAPGLSQIAKNRMLDSVMQAVERSKSIENPGEIGGSGQTLDRRSDDTQKTSVKRARLSEPEELSRRDSKSRFRLIRQIGEGGLGRVWLARDEKLNRNVALKEMNETALQLPRAWQRFNREAEITGQLEHPNVITMYQYGNESKTSEPFYVMRFVGKKTLADAVDEYHERRASGQCDTIVLHRLLSAFLDVCHAIAYSHSRGVIHRDLKPENVALDNFGQVIVLDWGLAKITEDAEVGVNLSGVNDLTDEELARTTVGEIIGTPLYMAPEQAAGNLDQIDPQTDVYGLGAILFSILTGVAPHRNTHSDSEGGSFKETLSAIAERESPRPRDVASCIPLELDNICRRAMANKKYSRYESAAELANDVERWMADQGSRQSKYENLRLEGRELRNNVQAAVRDLETNVRFMSKLPPIQELIHVKTDSDRTVWRDRLSTIFEGLLSAKPEFRSVSYSEINGEQYQELVRVNRHSTDHSTIRSIPRSRLRSGNVSDFSKAVISQNPDEVHTSLTCTPLCNAQVQTDGSKPVAMVAGVPVFDDSTEEPFGVVLIECDLMSVLRDQLSRRMTAKDVVVACDTYQIMVHSNDEQGIVDNHVGAALSETLPQFEQARETLQSDLEFIDETDQLVYGSRLWLINKKHGMMFLLGQ
jgi:serine/threonine protein kinase